MHESTIHQEAVKQLVLSSNIILRTPYAQPSELILFPANPFPTVTELSLSLSLPPSLPPSLPLSLSLYPSLSLSLPLPLSFSLSHSMFVCRGRTRDACSPQPSFLTLTRNGWHIFFLFAQLIDAPLRHISSEPIPRPGIAAPLSHQKKKLSKKSAGTGKI